MVGVTVVGVVVGCVVGWPVGGVGDIEGEDVVGAYVCPMLVGLAVEGEAVGSEVGEAVGSEVAVSEGDIEGLTVGPMVGDEVGSEVVGPVVGSPVMILQLPPTNSYSAGHFTVKLTGNENLARSAISVRAIVATNCLRGKRCVSK